MQRTKVLLTFILFIGCVYGANWALDRYGEFQTPVIGWIVPAGVLFAGLAFGFRDMLREFAGEHAWRFWVISAIAAGTVLSYWLTDAVTIPGGKVSLAVASGIAFAVSELADLAVYEPLRKRGWVKAVIASNTVGAVVDSLLFLWLAFGAIDYVGGQILGKVLMIAPILVLMKLFKAR